MITMYTRYRLSKAVDLATVGAGVIVNPRAGRVKSKYYGDRSFWDVLKPGRNVRVTATQDELLHAVEDFLTRKFRYVIVIGGDGTLNRVLNALINMAGAEALPVILPLKGGTTNAVMSSMGLNGTAHRLLDQFLEMARDEVKGIKKIPLAHQHLLSVRDDTEDSLKYSFTFLNGIAYRIIAEYFDNENHVFMDAVKAGARPLLEWFMRRDSNGYFEPVKMRVWKQDGIIADGDVNVVFASTMDKLILLYSPFKEELGTGNEFHCLVNTMPIRTIFRHFVPLARGKIDMDGHFNEKISEDVFIESASGYTLDGEIHHRYEPFRITISPGPSFRYPIIRRFGLEYNNS
jgi:diacylglycerol kinase family enzyme